MNGPKSYYAWGVAFSAFLINLITGVLIRSSSFLYVAIINTFGINREQAVVPFGVQFSTLLLLGPVVGILGQRYSVRIIVLMGGILGTAGAFSSFFAPDNKWITCTWGVTTGIGLAMASTLLPLLVGQNFKKHRTTATGLSDCGNGFGGILSPLLVQYSLYKYGLHGTFFILAGFAMHIIPASIIFKNSPWMRTKRNNQPSISMNGKSKNISTVNIDKIHDIDDKNPNREEIVDARVNHGGNLNIMELKNGPCCSMEIPFFGNEILFSTILFEAINFLHFVQKHKRKEPVHFYENHSRASKTMVEDFLYKLYDQIDDRRNAYDYKTMSVQPKYSPISPKSVNLENIIEGTFKDFKTDQVVKGFYHYLQDIDSNLCNSQISEKIQVIISQMIGKFESKKPLELHNVNFDKISTDKTYNSGFIPIKKTGFVHYIKATFKLTYNPIFCLICLIRIIHFVSWISVLTVLIDFSMDKGLHEDDGKLAVAALSAGDFVGRFGLGWITDRNYITLPRFMFIIMVIVGAIKAGVPWIYNKWALFCIIAFIGALQGSLVVRHPVLILKYLEADKQSIAMGCINFLPGCFVFGMPAYIGYFRDTLGSYDHMFHAIGAIEAAVGLLWIFEPGLPLVRKKAFSLSRGK